MLPETSPALLAQRTPGETDLRIFTPEVIPAGRHRVDPRRPGLRVVRNGRTGRAALRASVTTVRDVDLFSAGQASR